MQNHILEEARKIDLGQPIAGEPIPATQTQSSTFLDYGVPALLIGAGLASIPWLGLGRCPAPQFEHISA